LRSRQRVVNNGSQIVKTRLPFEGRTDKVAGGDEARRVARPAGRELDLEIDAGHAFHGLDHFQHGEATTITTIERRGGTASAQVKERISVCGDEIGNVNVISDAGTIPCRIVGSEDVHFGPQAERSLCRDLDEVRGRFGGLAGATERVGARDVEITQDYMAQPMGGGGVA